MKQVLLLLLSLMLLPVAKGQYFNNQPVYITDSIVHIGVDTAFHPPRYKPSVSIPDNTVGISPDSRDLNALETNKLFQDNKTFDKMLASANDSDYESTLKLIDKMSGKNMTAEQISVLCDWKLFCYRKTNKTDDIVTMFGPGNINLYYQANYVWPGYAFATKGLYADAIRNYEKAKILTGAKADKAFLYSAGVCYYNLNNFDKSVEYLDRYVAQGGDDTSAYYYLGTACFVLGKYDKAVAYLSKYTEKGGECEAAFYYLGIAAFNNRNYEKSVQDFDIYIQIGGKDVEAHFYKGLSNYNLGRHDSAFASMNRYFSKGGKNQTAVLYGAYSSVLQYYANKSQYNKLDDAIKYYTIYIAGLDAAKNNNRPWIYVNRAKAKMYKQDLAGAIADCDLQIKYTPSDLLAYEMKADFCERMRNISGAIDVIDLAMKSSGGNAWLYTLRARYKASNASYSSAMQDIEKAISLDNKNGMMYGIKGYILMKQNKNMDALACFDNAIKYDEKPTASSYYYRGVVKQQLNDLDEACKDWDTAIELKVFLDPMISHSDVEKMRNTYCK